MRGLITKTITIAAALTGGLLAAGCGADNTADSTRAQRDAHSLTQPTSAHTQTSARTSGRAPAVPALLRFTGTTLDGQTFNAASLAGRPVVLWSWTPGCAVCRGEAPNVAKVARQYSDRVAFVGVAGMADRKQMKEFAATTGVDAFTQLADDDGSL